MGLNNANDHSDTDIQITNTILLLRRILLQYKH